MGVKGREFTCGTRSCQKEYPNAPQHNMYAKACKGSGVCVKTCRQILPSHHHHPPSNCVHAMPSYSLTAFTKRKINAASTKCTRQNTKVHSHVCVVRERDKLRCVPGETATYTYLTRVTTAGRDRGGMEAFHHRRQGSSPQKSGVGPAPCVLMFILLSSREERECLMREGLVCHGQGTCSNPAGGKWHSTLPIHLPSPPVLPPPSSPLLGAGRQNHAPVCSFREEEYFSIICMGKSGGIHKNMARCCSQAHECTSREGEVPEEGMCACKMQKVCPVSQKHNKTKMPCKCGRQKGKKAQCMPVIPQ